MVNHSKREMMARQGDKRVLFAGKLDGVSNRTLKVVFYDEDRKVRIPLRVIDKLGDVGTAYDAKTRVVCSTDCDGLDLPPRAKCVNACHQAWISQQLQDEREQQQALQVLLVHQSQKMQQAQHQAQPELQQYSSIVAFLVGSCRYHQIAESLESLDLTMHDGPLHTQLNELAVMIDERELRQRNKRICALMHLNPLTCVKEMLFRAETELGITSGYKKFIERITIIENNIASKLSFLEKMFNATSEAETDLIDLAAKAGVGYAMSSTGFKELNKIHKCAHYLFDTLGFPDSSEHGRPCVFQMVQIAYIVLGVPEDASMSLMEKIYYLQKTANTRREHVYSMLMYDTEIPTTEVRMRLKKLSPRIGHMLSMDPIEEFERWNEIVTSAIRRLGKHTGGSLFDQVVLIEDALSMDEAMLLPLVKHIENIRESVEHSD